MSHRGRILAPGIGVGRVAKWDAGTVAEKGRAISDDEVLLEQRRLHRVLQAFLEDIEQWRLPSTRASETADEIVNVYSIVVQDPVFVRSCVDAIAEERIDAGLALRRTVSKWMEQFRERSDDFMAQRAFDIESVVDELCQKLQGEHARSVADDVRIVFANRLNAFECLRLIRQGVTAFVTEQGSYGGHESILARSLGVAFLTDVSPTMTRFADGGIWIVDALEGHVDVRPTEHEIETANERRDRWVELRIGGDEDTVDRPMVRACLDTLDQASSVSESGAKGVGLCRTEFLLNSGSGRSDEAIYEEVVRRVGSDLIVFRLYDAHGDKAGFAARRPSERAQIDALLEVAKITAAPFKILIPMVSQADEVQRVKDQVALASTAQKTYQGSKLAP
ncbi:MAG: phosphoenolpyruvate-utilizing N-terminal domain-containing protein [Polyangiales bacterium]